MPYHDQLLQAIETGSERQVHTYLKLKSRPLIVAFAHGWHFNFALPEFRFGADYRADFLIVTGHSGACHVSFVELEPPSANCYLKDGTESKTLRKAMRQVKDWDAWVDRNESSFRQSLAAAVHEHMHDHEFLADPCTYSGHRLLDPHTIIWKHYAIVIGRRANLSPRDQEQRSRESLHTMGLDIATYDRLLDIAASDDWGEHEIAMAKKGIDPGPSPFNRSRWKELL